MSLVPPPPGGPPPGEDLFPRGYEGASGRKGRLSRRNSSHTESQSLAAAAAATAMHAAALAAQKLRQQQEQQGALSDEEDGLDSADEDEERKSQRRKNSGSNNLFPPGFNACVRRNSQQAFAEKKHTTLLLDWDDTVFPTTWVRNDCGMNWKLPLEDQLEAGPRKTLIKDLLATFLTVVETFMDEACASANVFIVTLARRPWVEISTTNFLPGLGGKIRDHHVKVIYAQEYVTEKEMQEYQRDEFLSTDETKDFWTRVKSEAISREVGMYHEKLDMSWKNLISLGDSDFERYGTIAAGEEYIRRGTEGGSLLTTGATSEGVSKDGHLKRLRTKTVKMLCEPTIEELTAELVLLRRWLPYMIRQDSGFDIVLDSTEDDVQLRELHKQITGEDEDLSWQRLAGVEP
eukprot:TRINITY_DN25957_c0_g1_i1.p1 TRINITY_DN25957_c0_g1~~TRINITY_DN25957_c0_g1_i1.p1  ORF type:complete len:404 (-),score=108.42 TRINITY_DN25957_c0_g1_i1:198-1409(-)